MSDLVPVLLRAEKALLLAVMAGQSVDLALLQVVQVALRADWAWYLAVWAGHLADLANLRVAMA